MAPADSSPRPVAETTVSPVTPRLLGNSPQGGARPSGTALCGLAALLATWLIAPLVLRADPAEGVALLNEVRLWSAGDVTRVALETSGEVRFKYDRLKSPERVYIDLYDTVPKGSGVMRTIAVGDRVVKQIRYALSQKTVTRVVIDLEAEVEMSTSQLSNPDRVMIELRRPSEMPGARTAPGPSAAVRTTYELPSAVHRPEVVRPSIKASVKAHRQAKPFVAPAASNAGLQTPVLLAGIGYPPVLPSMPVQRMSVSRFLRQAPVRLTAPPAPAPAVTAAAVPPAPPVTTSVVSKPKTVVTSGASVPSRQPAGELAATTEPRRRESSRVPSTEVGPAGPLTVGEPAEVRIASPAQRDRTGKRSLTRVLGLKLGRVVLDAGHGGHDTGTITRSGLMEKELVLDVTLRLGKLIDERLRAEVIYTRADDTFIPLEKRAVIANENQADLFLSIHANSSQFKRIVGTETFYLNFTNSQADMDVAARENAGSEKSMHELSDLLRKIALKDKKDESREFADRIQEAAFDFSSRTHGKIRNRGVKTAPFVVLIGAEMPSVLTEIGFMSNSKEEGLLKKSEHRQKIAEALFKGIVRYTESLSNFKVAQRQ
ncbi:MAG: N-acetylmuramoyl-L-alanine amidase [Acidobacteriia bacterium]|nr:N-acetylmuramoyl-L-alanine amidase [Terriglobia bacterium]